MIFLLICLLTFPFAQSSITKQYRKDYTYYRKTDSFYKFNLENTFYSKAKAICENEGGALFIPSSDEEMYYVHAMVFKQNPDIGNYVLIGKDAVHLESAEIEPLIYFTENEYIRRRSFFSGIGPRRMRRRIAVMTRGGELESADESNIFPFICKVDAKDVVYDSQCDIYIKGYEYHEDVGSCYKIPRIIYSWNEAFDECEADGAHLVVLNSELEHSVVHRLIQNTQPVLHAQAPFFLFAGIRAEKKLDDSPVVFKTIFNQTLAEAGYDKWSDNEPNNALNSEYCGTIFKNDGNYNDVDCTHLYGFICEKNVNK